MTKHLRRLGVGVAAIAALGATLAMPGSAQAGDQTYLNCHPGNVCLYNGGNIPVVQTPHDWTGSQPATMILNNGRKHVGADHVRYRGTIGYADGSFRPIEGCLHWREDGPTAGSAVNFPTNTVITRMTWGGECAGHEPPIKLGPIGS